MPSTKKTSDEKSRDPKPKKPRKPPAKPRQFKNDSDAAEGLTRFCLLQNDIDRQKGIAYTFIVETKAELVQKTEGAIGEMQSIFLGLENYGAEHRDRIVETGTKTAPLGTGKLIWRDTPESTVFDTTAEEMVQRIRIAIAKSTDPAEIAKLKGFLRETVEPNKEAMLADKELAKKITGVSFTSTEMFYIHPDGMEKSVGKPTAKQLLAAPKADKVNGGEESDETETEV